MIRRVLKGAVFVAVLALCAGGSWYLFPVDPDPRPDAPAAPLITVEVLPAQLVDRWVAKAQFSGMVKPKRKSDLSFERLGRIEKVSVEQGDHVESNQVLAVLNTEMIEVQIRKLQADHSAALSVLNEMKAGPRVELIDAARATVKELDTQLDQARRNLERRQSLAKSEAISREDFEQSQMAVRRLEATRTNAQKTLEDLELGTRIEKVATQEAIVASLKESIAAAQVELDHSTLRSPFKGTIVERFVHEGFVSQPGTPAFAISEDSALEAQFGIPPSVAQSLHIGQELKLIIRSQLVDAKLKSLTPQIDEETRTLRIVASIQASTKSVYPGDIANLELDRTHETAGYWLATSQITQGQRGLWDCFVVEPESCCETGRIVVRPIEIVHSEGDRVLVRGAIRSGELIVSGAVNRIVNGQRVKYVEREAE